MPLRVHFQEKLDEIRSDVIRMGEDANEMVRLAVEATINGDTDLAQRVIFRDDGIDALERDAVYKTVMAVLQEAPVARDLRFLMSTIGIVSEIEKVGDDAVKLSRRATKLSGQFPAELRLALTDLGEQARTMFASSLRLYCDYSRELAQDIIRSDKQVDTAYSKARNRLFDLIMRDPSATEHLVRTIECFHALEHVADHAVAIAVRMKMFYESPPQSVVA